MVPQASRTEAHPERPRILWEAPDCPLCGGARLVPQLQAQESHAGDAGLWFAVAGCQECGLYLTAPRPDAASQRAFEDPAYDRVHPGDWLPLLPAPQSADLLLDLAGLPAASHAQLQRLGWECHALDPLWLQFPERPNLRLYGSGDDLFPRDAARAILLGAMLPRLRTPVPTLRFLYERLQPAGNLYLSVPNFAGWAARGFGPAWYGLDLPRHLLHFAPATLRKLLEKTGFTVRYLWHKARPQHWQHSARRMRGTWSRRLLGSKLGAVTASTLAACCGAGDELLVIATKDAEV